MPPLRISINYLAAVGAAPGEIHVTDFGRFRMFDGWLSGRWDWLPVIVKGRRNRLKRRGWLQTSRALERATAEFCRYRNGAFPIMLPH
jgi:hypothetical protein